MGLWITAYPTLLYEIHNLKNVGCPHLNSLFVCDSGCQKDIFHQCVGESILVLCLMPCPLLIIVALTKRIPSSKRIHVYALALAILNTSGLLTTIIKTKDS